MKGERKQNRSERGMRWNIKEMRASQEKYVGGGHGKENKLIKRKAAERRVKTKKRRSTELEKRWRTKDGITKGEKK